jgi:hypothetical protein
MSHECKPGETWALYDARGIYCCKVCEVCEEDKRARYRADIFTDANYWADEDID